MGTNDVGPFANDGAADFLGEAAESPSRAVGSALRALANAPAGTYLDVDAGQAAHAAAEIVALAFGRPDAEIESTAALEIAAKVKPTEALRLLALRALERVTGPSSEVGSLWAEGADGAAFNAGVDRLRARLVDSASGPRKVARPRAGDVIAVPHDGETLVVQVVAPREVVVFRGECGPHDDPLAMVARLEGTRTPCEMSELTRLGRTVGRAPVQAPFKGKKLYALEVGEIEKYALVTGAHTGWRWVTFEEARDHDVYERRRIESWARLAHGDAPRRPRSPDEREAAIRHRSKDAWEKRRSVTTPGPFGDPSAAKSLFAWVHDGGASQLVANVEASAAGRVGGGNSESHNRWSYGRAAIIALWAGCWPITDLPEALRAQIPPRPEGDLACSLAGARTILGGVLSRESELRMMWEEAPDGGAAFHAAVAALLSALAG